MSTRLGTAYPATYEGRPTRSSKKDAEIWERWLPTIRDKILTMWFDVGLGSGAQAPAYATEKEAEMWLYNTQKRADVLIETQDEVWIVELRDNAQASAVGRLLLYQELLQKDNPIEKRSRMYLVTDRRDDEVAILAETNGITYIVV